jgi:hypothetical protein
MESVISIVCVPISFRQFLGFSRDEPRMFLFVYFYVPSLSLVCASTKSMWFHNFHQDKSRRGGELSFELEYESVSRDPKIHRSRFLLRVSISCSSACGRCRASRCQLPYGGDTEEVLAIQDRDVLGQLVPAVRPSLPIRVFTSCPCCRYQESDKTTVGGN